MLLPIAIVTLMAPPNAIVTYYRGPRGGSWEVTWKPLNSIASAYCSGHQEKYYGKSSGKGKDRKGDDKGKGLRSEAQCGQGRQGKGQA